MLPGAISDPAEPLKTPPAPAPFLDMKQVELERISEEVIFYEKNKLTNWGPKVALINIGC